jgi:hypothetical protein
MAIGPSLRWFRDCTSRPYPETAEFLHTLKYCFFCSSLILFSHIGICLSRCLMRFADWIPVGMCHLLWLFCLFHSTHRPSFNQHSVFYLPQWNNIIHGWYDTYRIKPKYPEENLSVWTKWYWESFYLSTSAFPSASLHQCTIFMFNSSAIRAVESQQLTASLIRQLSFPVTHTVTHVRYLPSNH